MASVLLPQGVVVIIADRPFRYVYKFGLVYPSLTIGGTEDLPVVPRAVLG